MQVGEGWQWQPVDGVELRLSPTPTHPNSLHVFSHDRAEKLLLGRADLPPPSPLPDVKTGEEQAAKEKKAAPLMSPSPWPGLPGGRWSEAENCLKKRQGDMLELYVFSGTGHMAVCGNGLN